MQRGITGVRDALVDCDPLAAEDQARALLQEGASLRDLYDALTELLYDVGELWACRELTVAGEHTITAAVEELVVRLRGAPPPALHGTVVLAPAAGERHVVGLRMLAHVLEQEGFRVRLSPYDLPWDQLAELATTQPNLVAVGVSLHATDERDDLQPRIVALRRALGVPVLLGGSAFLRGADGLKWGADAVVTTAWDGVDLLRRLASPLTPRETEVLQAIARGLDNNAAAELLGVRPSTVKAHLDRVFEKLQVTTRAGAVATAMRHGLIG